MFKPNELKVSDVDGLLDWQILVAACHFGKTMTDCVNNDYTYTESGGEIFMGDISMRDDIDLSCASESLERYADIGDWREIAKKELKNKLIAKNNLGGYEEIKSIAADVVKALRTHGHPHMRVIIDCNSIEVLEGVSCLNDI